MKTIGFFVIILFVLNLSSCYYDVEEELYPQNAVCDTTQVSFAQFVYPLIQNQCLSCHSAASASGSVVLEGYNNVKTYATNGKLYGVIAWNTGFSQMPKGGNKLDACSIKKINSWVKAGSLNN